MSKWIDYDAIDYRFDRIQDQSPDFIGGVIYANACVMDAPSIDALSEWIPCSERLPSEFSDDERVLATTDVDGLGVILMPAYDVKSWYLKGYISAWMPLPKLYGEREDE